MLMINNQPLPEPSALIYEGHAPETNAAPSLLRLKAEWRALSLVETARACGLAQGAFTLQCLDPMTNQSRAFAAALKALRLEQAGPAHLNLWMTLEERST